MNAARIARLSSLLLGTFLIASPAAAAELDGRLLGGAWAIPFAGVLLSIALFPLFSPHVWEHHQGKIAAAWSALTLLPMLAVAPVAPRRIRDRRAP